MDTDPRYIKNSETVEIIGGKFGFKIYGFDPDWAIFYNMFRDGVCTIPDKFMEQVAKTMGLPWENKYESHLTTTTLDKALLKRAHEDNEYRAACFASQLIISIRSETAIRNMLRL